MEVGDQRPRIDLGLKLAHLFGVPLDWLADDGQDWPPPKSDEQSAADIVKQALTNAGLAGELTDEETELLALIRAVGPAQRLLVRGVLMGLDSQGISMEDVGPYLQEGVDEVRRARKDKRRDGHQ